MWTFAAERVKRVVSAVSDVTVGTVIVIVLVHVALADRRTAKKQIPAKA